MSEGTRIPGPLVKRAYFDGFLCPKAFQNTRFHGIFVQLCLVSAPHAFSSCRIFVALFCRTITGTFSSAKINKVSVSIISEEWDHSFFLLQKEWSRVASMPYFRMLRPSKFRRSDFGGRCGEGRELLFDIKLFSLLHPRSWLAYIKSASINIFSTPSY